MPLPGDKTDGVQTSFTKWYCWKFYLRNDQSNDVVATSKTEGFEKRSHAHNGYTATC